MENKILKKFEATDVIIEVIDGIPMFELYSTGMALGYVKTAKGRQYARTERIDNVVKINTKVITMLLLTTLIASGSILPIPGTANADSVIRAPEIDKIIDPGIPLTIGIIAFFKMCLLKISVWDKPFARANLT